ATCARWGRRIPLPAGGCWLPFLTTGLPVREAPVHCETGSARRSERTSRSPMMIDSPQLMQLASAVTTVLIVADDAGIAELERGRLEDAGYRAIVATTANEALDALAVNEVDLILLDYLLPDADGLDFYGRVKSAGYDIPVILVTGFSSEATLIRAL